LHIKIKVKINFLKKKKGEKKEKTKKNNTTAQIGTNVRVRGFNAGLLDRSQLHSECRETGQFDEGFPWFSLVPEQMLSWYRNIHVALHASHAALLMVTLKISLCTNVTLTLTLGWITLFMGDMGEGALHREDEVTVKRRN
jgi:hypothetical protein